MTKKTIKFSGWRTLLVALYAILTLAALGRSSYQIIRNFPDISLAYWLSALAAVVYLAATLSLVWPKGVGRKIAWATISFELIGVLVVGAISIFAPEWLGHSSASFGWSDGSLWGELMLKINSLELFGNGATVWSGFGLGYGLVPLILPIAGLVWLAKTEESESVA